MTWKRTEGGGDIGRFLGGNFVVVIWVNQLFLRLRLTDSKTYKGEKGIERIILKDFCNSYIVFLYLNRIIHLFCFVREGLINCFMIYNLLYCYLYLSMYEIFSSFCNKEEKNIYNSFLYIYICRYT